MAQNPMVLVVDDDEMHLLLLKHFFTSAGIAASCVSNGEDALEEIAARSFSFLITDVNMPRMNGFELAKKAKQLAPQMLIALCTGDNFPSVRSLAAETGIDTVFNKPVDYRKMVATVTDEIQKLALAGC